MHIEQVLGDVPKDERCQCRESSSPEADGSGGSWFARLFKKRG